MTEDARSGLQSSAERIKCPLSIFALALAVLIFSSLFGLRASWLDTLDASERHALQGSGYYPGRTQVVPLSEGLGVVGQRDKAGEDGKDAGGSGFANFDTRCKSPGVLRCVGFDSTTEISGNYGMNSGILPGAAMPSIDTEVKASGRGSLRFTVPPVSGANSSGSYFTNYSADLSQQFGEKSDFYIQWRQRFSTEFLTTQYRNGEGWKQAIIGTGDRPGHLYTSCSDLEIVIQNGYQRGFPTIYNSCSGSSSHGPYDGFQERYGPYDFKLQNARPSPYCLYSQGKSAPPTFFPPKGNCFGYFANEWMTFQVHIKTGPRVNDEFANSYVELWIAREGQRSEPVISWGPYNLTAGASSEVKRFGKIWLLPYNTGKDEKQNHPTGYVWYDELVISHDRIQDPL